MDQSATDMTTDVDGTRMYIDPAFAAQRLAVLYAAEQQTRAALVRAPGDADVPLDDWAMVKEHVRAELTAGKVLSTPPGTGVERLLVQSAALAKARCDL